jgi:hypothetical protein
MKPVTQNATLLILKADSTYSYYSDQNLINLLEITSISSSYVLFEQVWKPKRTFQRGIVYFTVVSESMALLLYNIHVSRKQIEAQAYIDVKHSVWTMPFTTCRV